MFDGLAGIFHFKDHDGINIEVEVTKIETDVNGNQVGTITAMDEYAMSNERQFKVVLPNEIIQGESPFVVENPENDNSNLNKKKIIIGAGIGAMIVGATYEGAKYYIEHRRK